MAKTPEVAAARRGRLVRQWRQSDEPSAAFARRHGIHPRTFWGWCHAEAKAAPPPAVPAFRPVRVVDAVPIPTAGELEIVLPDGTRILWRGDRPAEWLAHAVAVLRRPC